MRHAALVVTALSLVFACKASEPVEQHASKPAAPASEVATPSEAAPTPTPIEAAPTPTPDAANEAAPTDLAAPAKTSWWCVCHDGATECLPSESECRTFAKTIGDDLTHGCRTLAGDHPGDAMDSREGWNESKTPGGWVSDDRPEVTHHHHLLRTPAGDREDQREAILEVLREPILVARIAL